ncbi:trypsin-like peptidase domain-containing protein [Actinomadura fulvescens]|uniref:Trypsin-like peptidase domain-containing protein n=1 Tax=Actinomadura fulvescens TaxID=46160 RepID=A0ABN3PV86_9ACTN
MHDWQWRAWVGEASGEPRASAFLVTPTKLLTCAHAVSGRNGTWVGFPGLTGPLPAKVVSCGDWQRPGDDGDVAVLELSDPVPYPPARLAAPDILDRPSPPGPPAPGAHRVLGTYGFPNPRERFERHITVTTGPSMMQRREWWQVKAEPGDQILEGYSGAAVYDPHTREVVGMVTDSDLRGTDGQVGRMLPLAAIRRYWEELDDHLPLTWLTRPARHSLRRLLTGAVTAAPLEELVTEAVGPIPGWRGFRSVWDAVRSVAEGWPDDPERLTRWIAVLRRHLPDRDLAAWTRTHLPDARAATGTAADGTASVIVRLERVTHDNAYDVTVHTWIDGAEGARQETVRVPERAVRQTVETGLARARGAMVGRHDWMIEFAVPESWLGKPFEEWYVEREHRLPMIMYPVVVRDVERLRPDSIRRDQAHRRWRVLRERGRSEPERVDCGRPRAKSAFQNWLMANSDVCVLVYGARPVKGWVTAALNTGIPVMAWPRSRCAAPGCTGRHQLDELADALAGRHPDLLPALVMELRKQALVAPADEPHCGRELTLLWDDPSRLPDPPLAMEV